MENLCIISAGFRHPSGAPLTESHTMAIATPLQEKVFSILSEVKKVLGSINWLLKKMVPARELIRERNSAAVIFNSFPVLPTRVIVRARPAESV